MPLLSTFGAASARSFGGIGAAAASAGLDISEVFSIFAYTGDGTNSRQINNGIDLSGEGGMVITAPRSNGNYWSVADTKRGATRFLYTNGTNAEQNNNERYGSFNSNGYTMGSSSSNGYMNYSNYTYCSWSFRVAPNFFDVQKWGGNEVSGRQILHNLGSVPGVVIIKKRDSDTNYIRWFFWHRSLTSGKFLTLNTTNAEDDDDGDFVYSGVFNSAPDSSGIYLENQVNQNQYDYVAYFFAHNNSDGGFGPDSDQDIIKCGTYTGNGNSNGTEVNVGFEPQWLLIKCKSDSGGWQLVDAIRGVASFGDDKPLRPDSTNSESTANYFRFTPTGFALESTSNTVNGNNKTYIYMAIRRGPLAVPEAATSLFSVLASRAAAGTPSFDAGFPVDMSIVGWRGGGISGYQQFRTRLTWDTRTATATATNDSSNYPYEVDNMSGLDAPGIAANTNSNAWMWRRSRTFMDVVTFKGSTTNPLNVTHGLEVVPEMIWLKPRTSGPYTWWVYHSGIGAGGGIKLNENEAAETGAAVGQTLWNNTAPTSTVFTVGNQSNTNNNDIPTTAVLFATLPGISKVGSYTGNGGTQTIDCGFTSSARYILIKRTDSTGNWAVFDTARGIASGDDKIMYYNKTNAEATGQYVNPNSSGFELSTSDGDVNASSATYIFYAIA